MQNRSLLVHLEDRAEEITLQTKGDIVLQRGNREQATAIARLRYRGQEVMPFESEELSRDEPRVGGIMRAPLGP